MGPIEQVIMLIFGIICYLGLIVISLWFTFNIVWYVLVELPKR